MRQREKERIFRRFMEGHSVQGISMELLVTKQIKNISYDDILSCRAEVEQAVRDVIQKMKGTK
jgi:hypothetical protein